MRSALPSTPEVAADAATDGTGRQDHADEPPGSPKSATARVRTAPADKVRIRFRKSGTLRLLSHHDLMRTFERLLRRCDLPYHRSQGFHPKPRLVFALSLPLGVIGCQEVVELELDRLLPPEEIHDRLARRTPPGLEILSVRRIPLNCTAQVCRLCYAVPVPEARLPELQQRINDVLAQTECWIDRDRPHARQPGRRLDVRPFLADLCLRTSADSANPSPVLEMDLHLTPAGTARPDEVLTLLGVHDLLDAGAVLARTRLELYDELPPSAEGSAIELEKVAHEKRDAD